MCTQKHDSARSTRPGAARRARSARPAILDLRLAEVLVGRHPLNSLVPQRGAAAGIPTGRDVGRHPHRHGQPGNGGMGGATPSMPTGPLSEPSGPREEGHTLLN